MTAADANDLVKRILASYPTQRLRMSRDDVLAMSVAYAAGLIDLDFDLARAAVDRACKTSEWIPTIAKIRAECGELAHGDAKTGAEAWGSVLRAIREKGSHRTPGVDFVFHDPITVEVVSALGWLELCAAGPIGMAAARSRFVEAYEEIGRQRRKNAQASHGAVAPQLTRSSRRQLATRVERAAPMLELLDGIVPESEDS